VNLSVDLFISAGIIAFVLSLLAITVPSLMGAASNPIKVIHDN
jgi:hypothetical protein